MHSDLLCTPDKHGIEVLSLLDLSDAFDTIDHAILLQIMESLLNVHGTILEWFRSYLSGRSQNVRIRDAISHTVPQGSLLSPLIFLISILPLGHLITSLGVNGHGFPDDTQLYITFTKPKEVVVVQQE